MYRVKRQRPGIYYAEILAFSFEKLIQLRQDLKTASAIHDEYKDVVIWKFAFKISFEKSSEDVNNKISIREFIRHNPIDYGHTIIITTNPFLASAIQFFHKLSPKSLGEVSFATDLDEAVEEALEIQKKKSELRSTVLL